MMRLKNIFFAAVLTFSSLPAMAGSWRVYPKAEEAFQVDIQLAKGQASIPVNKLSELTVTVSTPFAPKSQEKITQMLFDARMPEHNHGMLTKPTVTSAGDNSFKVSGVKLHMEGFWELIFVVTTSQGQRHKVVVPYTLTTNTGK